MDLSDQEADAGSARAAAPRAPWRWRRAAIGLLVLLAVAVGAAWLQRRTIARGFVDRELARRGVPARYEIEQLSPWRQRLVNVSIGDPRDPDLVADWIELRTSLYPWRAEVLVAKAGKVRARGRIVNGALSMGSLDRLLPPPSGKPFSLPRLIVDVADAQLRLDTGGGLVVLGLSGKGMLADGFAGTLRADASRLRIADCALEGVAARMQVGIRHGAPHLDGPVQAARIACADTHVTQLRVAVRAALEASLARWKGSADLDAAAMDSPLGQLRRLRGGIGFDGDGARTEGSVALRSGALAAAQVSAGSAAISGRYAFGGTAAFQGEVALEGAALPASLLGRVAGYGNVGQGTPVAPLVRRLVHAMGEAGRAFGGSAALELAMHADRTTLRVRRLDLAARSGARLRFGQDTGLGLDLRDGGLDLAGQLSLGGGGLPDAAVRLSRRPGSRELRGTGLVRPYVADGARLELSGLDFSVRGTAGDVRTAMTLSGPVRGGRVDGLSMPLLVHWDAQMLAVNPQCSMIGFSHVAMGGAVLDGDRLKLCPLGPAMVRWGPHGLAGGIRLAQPELKGSVGDSALRVAAEAAQLDLAASRFTVTRAAARLGGDRPTRLDIGQLDGSFRSGLSGEFDALGGQIGAVPLQLSEGKGSWHVENGDFLLRGSFTLADAEAAARFEPLAAPNGSLRLHDGKIDAQAAFVSPKHQLPVGTVKIAHDLARAEGQALLDVPGIRFHMDGLQPSDLTSLTYGVIADVDGLVAGTGRFGWSGDTVASTGHFTATDVALAAAFGPVQGLTTQLDFTDLLNLRSAPGQTANIAEINPGVPVRGGVLRYQLLDSRRVRVEGARWPFAGGELVLDPTVLDFDVAGERRLTFHVKGADAALFLKEMAFDNLDATGTFDGTLPMIFDARGGRIEGGELRARTGGHIAYVGEVSRQDVGFWGNMAFQALKSLDYKDLTIRMNGPLAGEMITDIGFSGVSQGKGTKSNFLIRRLARLPLVFNVRISAPFRQLLDSIQSWYDPRRLIERNLPSLIEEQNRAQEGAKPAVQPRESAPVP
ncbi:intermembrane phospholipid transport protein YdbH family protein [Sphingomonas leidyi]|uniref:intermembrane phospholipid transport protein YdbH family protein n=1 Tax=Sphingomonas leidyi TaxID=68569 RepID=UPI00141DAAA0